MIIIHLDPRSPDNEFDEEIYVDANSGDTPHPFLLFAS